MSFKRKNRKKYAMSSVIFQNAALKLIDLAIEVTMLRQLLQSGSLAVLTHIEGKYGSRNLMELPGNLSSTLPRL
ncbi:Hypothetical protein PHPALM_10153 [Phytophthora palmivora]|uniref:Uncharacterized protein n=1 Tax=Phytophthora palmivora TaxID=4796 RepID=A0A2P4Y5F2_9STRA|nr:Hypothetical protein PHPALM_10153 [Phytophthora palmivora]